MANRRKVPEVAGLALALLLCGIAHARDYYVSPKGNDSSPGTQPEPWCSIAKVNQTSFKPGDRVLFEGGKRFAGTIRFGADDSGTQEQSLLVSSYGNGRAVIDGDTGRAIESDGCSHVTFREGNIYWAMGDGGFSVDGYKSFAEWVAATGQEKIDNTIVGKYVDPLLRKIGTGLITNPAKLAALKAYLLSPGSPAIDAGLDLKEQFGLDPGRSDYYGNPIPLGAKFDIGAHEFTPGKK